MRSTSGVLAAKALAAAALIVAASAAIAAPAVDYDRETRWAQEVVPSLVVGDAVHLATPARDRVLALLTEPAGSSKGAIVLVHGLGVHPDWGIVGALRGSLADAGFTTLAVQMPVLAADASRADYAVTLPEATERITAAIAYFKQHGARRIAIVAHSFGAATVNAWLARPGVSAIDAWVALGMPGDFEKAPKEPVLDVIAERDFADVAAAAKRRKASLPKDACSRAIVIADADHYLERAQKELTAEIVPFLERAFARRCPS